MSLLGLLEFRGFSRKLLEFHGAVFSNQVLYVFLLTIKRVAMIEAIENR
jgi:hypothetical protein